MTIPKSARHLLATALLCLFVVSVLSLPAQAETTTYTITDGSTVLVHTSSSTDPAAVLLEAGILLGEDDTVTLSDDQIVVRRAQLISIYDGNNLIMAGSYGETVGELLARQQITLGEDDRIDCALTQTTSDGMSITITRVSWETVECTETIEREVTIYEDATLPAGEEVVLVEGADGAVHTVYSVRYENGEEVSRSVLSQELIAQAVGEVRLCSTDRALEDHNFHLAASDAVDYQSPSSYSSNSSGSSYASSSGSYGSGTLSGSTVTTATGEVLTVKQVLACEATAYTCPGYVGTTATGTTARVGAIAVDPRFIPLGSKLYVVTDDGQYVYGYCTAEDTGGAIKGNIIDLYFNTWDECIQFGRRACTVYVLE